MSMITDIDLLDEAKDSFLVYAEEVLTDRAIPAAEDGLLSAQRKLLWTMEDYLKMNSKSKTKKCNAIVGSTLATSYFHGDAACYGVLRKMSQEYLMRYPLIKGQGQLGTQENNEMFSSSRYTEAKPAVYADLMFNDFKKNVVPMKETYNGEFMEPVVLPSLFPNAICNGRQAIGISMSHNSAPHNLTEVCNAAIALIQKGDLTIDELLEYIPGPDFPLGGKILNSKDIKEAFKTGKSKVSLKIQGDYELDGDKIIFTTIPYRTYRNKIKEQIEKNIDTFAELIDDFDDESNIGQNKLVFHVKKGVSVQKVLNQLFLLTDLQTTLSYNMNYIVNGTPKLCSMLDLLNAYIYHQETILINATYFDQEKAVARAHILEGLIAAVDQIDRVIEFIKSAVDRKAAKSALIDFLAIDEIQAEAILDMKLGKLTRIDKDELVNELEEKKAFIAECNEILGSKDKRYSVIADRIAVLRDKYGDARRTQLLDIEAPKKEKQVVIKDPENCVVVITNKGMMKRVPTKSFKTQKRNSAGTKSNGETTIFSSSTTTEDILMVFTSKGKMYRIVVDNIPEGTNTSVGVPLSSQIEFEDNEYPMAYATNAAEHQFIFFATKKGVVKKVPLSEYGSMKKTGILAIKLKEGDELAVVTFVNQEEVIMATKHGMAIRYSTAEMPISSRIAQGVKGMNVAEGDEVVAVVPIQDKDGMIIIASAAGLGKRVSLHEFNVQNRGGKGVICSKEEVVGAIAASEKFIVFAEGCYIVVDSQEIPLLGRTAAGVALLNSSHKILSIANI